METLSAAKKERAYKANCSYIGKLLITLSCGILKKGKSYKPQKPTAKTPRPGRQVGFRGFVDSSGNYGYYTKNPNN